ncbi:hypothetical protein [Winogradskya humida]|uniref:Uncharacterized protein n=1 Tax=Winogradskya humida TaxID=113566 RepID=A0ABQ3ZF73_9ACTN|nr:hypothetical protein [Actinoplanes humidus]GIE17236.1 hypothetical protein Ahu01nite_003380 [Actinoplanes humidus]
MPVIPVSTKTSLPQRLRARATANWPQLAAVQVRYHGQFAYVTVELTGGEQLPVMRLRYSGSAHRWSLATYRASNNSYEDQYWFGGTTEEALDFVCDVLVSPITDRPQQSPEPSTPEGLTN